MRALALASLLVLGACASEGQMAQQKEDLLAAAGFEARPANTPARQAMLGRLPPDSLVMRDVNGRTVYLYGDPANCRCVYFGDAAAYSRYRQERFQQHLADERQETAEIYSDPGWGWGPWGPGFWGGGFGAGFGPVFP